MISLGIESTAHTFGVGVVDDRGKIIFEERDMYVPPIGAGFVPNDLANHHEKIAAAILKKIDMEKIDVISFSRGPGIPNALMIGSTVARYLAAKYKKPLVGVNHAVAHIEIGKLKTGCEDPVVVYLSGGNTQILAHAEGSYRVLGESEDIPVGNALDVFARECGLKTPGGPEVEKLATGSYVQLPYVVKGMDLSFTGILTDAVKKRGEGAAMEDLCYSLQETCFAMLTEVAERALAHTGKKELLLVGGVAANNRLQEMMGMMCGDRGVKFCVVPEKYAGDNGANIAWTGILCKNSRDKSTGIIQNWRADEVDAFWV
ncbi:MAG: tRNA (adenosine(37)-N6)-threonylcarbamoyltransferase complex transferase subunit TsaD [Candidatus Aenigmarchaeota archaeon]|nr:tRNA (adenosine(37)-N6)-threonylcarbamoyltransferase complex transferase subunit TsaD [Candidatus Aenigmarchaeota archaeon]